MNSEPKNLCPVVIVDDDPSIRSSFRRALESEGYAVTTFENGKQAVEGLTASPAPCLIFLDLMMPEMDGWEFLAARTALPLAYSQAPVVIVSANVDGQRAREQGVATYFRKPVDLDDLFDVTKRYCRPQPSQA